MAKDIELNADGSWNHYCPPLEDMVVCKSHRCMQCCATRPGYRNWLECPECKAVRYKEDDTRTARCPYCRIEWDLPDWRKVEVE